MNKICELSEANIAQVSGGEIRPGESIVEYLERMYPFGEWVGNSFFPNGAPQFPTPGILTW